MSVANKTRLKWQQVAGIGVICSLALAGCSRSDDEDAATAPAEVTAEQPAAVDSEVAPAVSCDNPMVQDRLKNALKSTLDQQTQMLAASYANEAEVSIDNRVITDKVDGILIDVQNATTLQAANANGVTTCQASVSMTLASEDLYQTGQVRAANNQPSLQTSLAEEDIVINNNMLVDDAFSYVVGTQSGQVQVRIAGQPALVTVVSDIMASSVVKSAMDEQAAARQAQQAARQAREAERQAQEAARRREAARQELEEELETQPTPEAPAANQSSSQAPALPSVDAEPPAAAETPKATPDDDSIDMVIIEDESATY